MRLGWLAFALILAIGCGSNHATNLLCTYCNDDSQCGGNPCFVDGSGNHFCGSPCGSCPSGFSCHPVAGTSGTAESCFPDSLSCPVNNNATQDMAVTTTGSIDMANATPGDLALPPCTAPSSSGVSNTGGTVDRLFFGITGDTRPTNSGSSYPAALQMVINNIYTQMGQKGVQFAVDQGDHLEASSASDATSQMGNYMTAVGKLGKPVFMTLGNHECSNSYNPGSDCSTTCATDYKCSAFLNALKPVSPTNPYYRFDVMTSTGLAVFIVVADDAWNATQQSWLTTQLTDADAHAKFTFVSKHHPEGNADQTFFADIETLVRQHKYTLFLTGHSHEYKREPGDPRAIVMGLGGAPFDNPNQQFWGYGTIMQCPNDHIYVTVYDQASGNVVDTFNVPPQ